ncbi:MAG: spore germination protein [Clostridia bacterium]|nr:spore germination protein [Clostridia bacterium]
MQKLTVSYTDNIRNIDSLLRVNENFDIIKKTLVIADSELTLYYIDGFVKDGAMQKLMIYLLSIKELKAQGASTAAVFVNENIPYVEAEATDSVDQMLHMVMSGATLVLGKHFEDKAILIDSRTYPARSTQEPESDRVIRGARDGFVETLIFNTALIRRRIRDTSLTMHYMSIGSSSKTDVVLCYMADRADPGYVSKIKEKLSSIKTGSLTMGHQSIAECLLKTNWYNPFPKIRCTERPDNAAAHLEEGRLILLCDNTPEAMILPTSIFDFLQETNDYYFPPLTGTYLRLVRHAVSWLTLFMIPLWYLLINNVELVPDWLSFIIPSERGRIPILAQLLITEFIIDGMRMASMNTPNMLTNSLSVVGGLILGDFAIAIGWLIPEVILYMAFVTIANFSQSSYELGYAFKFLRILLLIFVALFNIWGFAIGLALVFILIATNKTVNGNRKYLYPLIPFNAKAMAALFFRVKKHD